MKTLLLLLFCMSMLTFFNIPKMSQEVQAAPAVAAKNVDKNNDDTATALVIVRPIEEKDQKDVAQIWHSGLQQTVQHCPWFVRPWIRAAFGRMAKRSFEENGDIGPNGSNLVKKWKNGNRCMFVATFKEHPEKVVGCVGVKRGPNEHDDNVKGDKDDINVANPLDDNQIASIWKMSVAETARRRGVGRALLEAAEEWARKQHQPCRIHTMQLVTMNPAAAQFYLQQGYARHGSDRLIPPPIRKKPLLKFVFLYLLPPVYYYRKPLLRSSSSKTAGR